MTRVVALIGGTKGATRHSSATSQQVGSTCPERSTRDVSTGPPDRGLWRGLPQDLWLCGYLLRLRCQLTFPVFHASCQMFPFDPNPPSVSFPPPPSPSSLPLSLPLPSSSWRSSYLSLPRLFAVPRVSGYKCFTRPSSMFRSCPAVDFRFSMNDYPQ